jgi:hypothetical protein
MEKIRKTLLEETNYRCGSCMRNITPRVYYLNDSPDKNPIHDYAIYNYEKKAYYDTKEQKFYNISDRCHITPNAEVDDEYNDFYNLIALCKICHHEVDKAKMLNTKELKRLKLHWMILSGRFTRVEIDCIMELHLPPLVADNNQIFVKPYINNSPNEGHFYYEINAMNIFLFRNIIRYNFIICELHRGGLQVGTKTGNVRPADFYIMVLTDKGIEFCEKFKDVYEK